MLRLQANWVVVYFKDTVRVYFKLSLRHIFVVTGSDSENGILSSCCCCRFSRVQLCATPQTAAHHAPRPWDSPGKNTGVGCHFLLQCMKMKSESEVVQLCPTLATPWAAAYQAPPSMGFSRQKYWSGVPLPSPILSSQLSLTVYAKSISF